MYGRRGDDPQKHRGMDHRHNKRRDPRNRDDGTNRTLLFDAVGNGPRRNSQAQPILARNNATVRWVEIPKTGSSTVTGFLVDGNSSRMRPDSSASFAVVEGNFGRYVDLVLRTGDETDPLVLDGPCGAQLRTGWEHTLSQMWFIDLFPYPIDHVLRFEDLDHQLTSFVEKFGLRTTRPRVPPPMKRKGCII